MVSDCRPQHQRPDTVNNVVITDRRQRHVHLHLPAAAAPSLASAGTWVRTGLYNVAGHQHGRKPDRLPHHAGRVLQRSEPGELHDGHDARHRAGRVFLPGLRAVLQDARGRHGQRRGQRQQRSPPRAAFRSSSRPARPPTTTRAMACSRATTSSRPRPITPAAPAAATAPRAPTCTYAEEIQNYARWYTYYRTRLNAMKTAGGRAFQSFIHNPTASPTQPTKMRVGFITINAQKDGNGSLQGNVQGVALPADSRFRRRQRGELMPPTGTPSSTTSATRRRRSSTSSAPRHCAKRCREPAGSSPARWAPASPAVSTRPTTTRCRCPASAISPC